MKLLLTTNADVISLDEAAKLLLGDGQNPSYMRNANAVKVRRLYDIANVLSSLNLIEKTHQSETRKPAFRWLGKGKCESGVTIALPPVAQKSGKRMFGTELTNVDVKRTELLSSLDNKPNKTQMLSHDLKECNKAVQRQLQDSKYFVFDPFNPLKAPKEEVAEQKVDDVSDFENFASSLSMQAKSPTTSPSSLEGKERNNQL